MRKLQIGVIGSCLDLDLSEDTIKCAQQLGKLIAESGDILVFGAEKDIDSLPTVAAKSAIRSGGITVGMTYEKGMNLFDNKAASIVIATGLVRGGGRELSLMLSCDVVIAVAGGSGTLNEICIAYQANIPVIIIKGYGGWSDKLSGTFLDERIRYRFEYANTAKQALDKARLI